MMGHDDHGSHVMPVAAVDSTETTTHNHGSMTTQHAHGMMGMTMQVINYSFINDVLFILKTVV